MDFPNLEELFVYVIRFMFSDGVYILSNLFPSSGTQCSVKYSSTNQVMFGLLLMIWFGHLGSVWSSIDGSIRPLRFGLVFC